MAEISIENEHVLDELVAAGRFVSREDALEQAVMLLRSDFASDVMPPSDSLSASEWCERFQAWAEGHREVPYEADDSRESIYAGRGE